MNLNLSYADVIAFVSVVLPLLVPLGQHFAAVLAERLPQARREHLMSIVETVVNGVEQGMSGQPGDVKKAEAVKAVQVIAKAAHLNVPDSLISMLIECAVAALHAQQPATVPAPAGVPSAAL